MKYVRIGGHLTENYHSLLFGKFSTHVCHFNDGTNATMKLTQDEGLNKSTLIFIRNKKDNKF